MDISRSLSSVHVIRLCFSCQWMLQGLSYGRRAVEVVKELVAKGADLDTRSNRGETALMRAVERASTLLYEYHRADVIIPAIEELCTCVATRNTRRW